MKSIMKSAFAILAVAMMIMVAVVPMVSVFTGDSSADATTAVDPTVSGTGVTITVKVYGTDGNAITNGTNLVKLTYTAGSSNYTMTAAVGSSISFTAQEKEISNVVLTYVDKDGVAVPGYGTASLGTLTKGSYTASIVAGLKSEQLVFNFKNGNTDVMGAFPTGATMSGSYDVYTNTSDSADTATVYKTKQSIDSTGTTTVYYPASASYVYVKVTSLSVSGTGVASGAITYTTPTTPVKISSSDAVKVNENLIEVALDSSFTMKSIVLTVNGITTEGVTYKKISDKMQYGTTSTTAKFTTTSDVPTDSTKVTLSLTAPDNTTQTAGAIETTITDSKFIFKPATEANKAFFGTVYMSAAAYWQTGTLSMKFTTSTVKDRSAAVGENGEFFTFISEATEETKIKEMTFKSGSQTYALATPISAEGLEIDFNCTMVTLDSTGYSLVSGALVYTATSDTGIVGKTMAVSSGVKTFGQLVTGTDGAFAFMAETGKNTSLKPTDSVVYTGDVNVTVGSGTTNLKVNMATKEITIKVANALGTKITANTVTAELKTSATSTAVATLNGNTNGVLKATVRGDLVPTDYKLYITDGATSGDKYTFAQGVAFVEGSTYKALEATYSITLYENDGVSTIDSDNYKVYVAKAYKNSLGSIVYTYDAETTVTSGSFFAKASIIAVKESDIGATPVDVILMVTNNDIKDEGIFKTYYILNADAEGAISIVASEDSLTGKLTRNDGVTGIAGIKAELYTASNSGTLVDTTYTQTDGTFTVYSDLAIGSEHVMKFTDATSSYTFSESYSAYDSKKVVAYKPTADAYTITFLDADGAEIKLGSNVAKIDDQTVTNSTVYDNVATLKYAWTKAKDLTVTLENTASPATKVRTFEDHALTAAEIASGKITIVSNQSTYTFNIADANGEPLAGNVQLYKYYGDYAAKITTTEGTATADSDGVATILLPLVSEEDLDTVYGYTVSLTNYAFSKSVAKITDVKIDVASTTGSKTVILQGATGAAIAITPSTVTVYADGATGPTATISNGYFTFLATAGVEYTYAIATTTLIADGVKYGEYSFEEGIADVDGVVTALEETIYGSITDAAGNYFGQKVKADVYYVGETTYQCTGVQNENDKKFMIVADKSEIDYYKAAYQLSVTQNKLFSFEKSETADIKAVETFVPIVFTTANGGVCTLATTNYSVKYMNTAGVLSSVLANFTVATQNGVVADLNVVDYFEVTVSVTDGNTFFPNGTYVTKDGALVSVMATYTGSVGVSGATGDVTVEIYNGSALVSRFVAEDAVDDGVYSIYANTSLGDKVIVTYVDSSGTTAKTYTAVMSNTVAYNDLQLVTTAPSLKANIVSSNYVTYELSADKSKVYLMALNTYNLPVSEIVGDANVDNLVANYVFAGWYVNGEKATKDLTYTVDNVDSNVVMALYEFDGYYEVDKPVSADNGISPTVLVIGIAAVIIALIAVVYAVIQKKE